MTAFGFGYLLLAGQIALLATLTGLLAALSGRHRPQVAARTIAFGLGACLALTLLALCPLPDWWSWASHAEAAPNVAVDASAEGEAAIESPTSHAAPNVQPTGVALGAFLRGVHQQMRQPRDPAWSWTAYVGLAALLLIGLTLTRLAAGLWGVHKLRRHSLPLTDMGIRRLLAGLRAEMGCRPEVEVRVTEALGVPATVGIGRPLLLLPPTWSAWTATELRAVVAHELAHVVRRDYLTGIVAQLCAALHPCQPLLLWLTYRLQLHQELAADAWAAPHAGGARPYLQALARLALRLDGRPPAWPLRPFLSNPGTLLRRIHMLQTRRLGEALTRRRSGVLLATFAVAALVFSAVRSPLMQAEPPKPAGQAAAAAPVYEPFDVRYAPDDAMGIFAARPAAFFGRPELAQVSREYNRAVEQTLTQFGLPAMWGTLGLRLEDIDQVVAGMYQKHHPDMPQGQRNSLLTNVHVIRTVKAFDWQAKLAVLMSDSQEKSHEGKKYLLLAKKTGQLLGPDYAYFVPDERTLVCGTEAHVQKVIARRAGDLPAGLKSAEWKKVERAFLAVAVDARRFIAEQKDPLPEDPPFQILRNLQSAFIAVDGPTCFSIRGHAIAASPVDAEQGAKLLETMFSDTGKKNMPPPGTPEAEFYLLKQTLLGALKIKQDGNVVQVETKTGEDLALFVARLMQPPIGK